MQQCFGNGFQLIIKEKKLHDLQNKDSLTPIEIKVKWNWMPKISTCIHIVKSMNLIDFKFCKNLRPHSSNYQFIATCSGKYFMHKDKFIKKTFRVFVPFKKWMQFFSLLMSEFLKDFLRICFHIEIDITIYNVLDTLLRFNAIVLVWWKK